MFRVELTKSFIKDFKRLPKEVQNVVIIKWIPRLEQNSTIGRQFVGKALKTYRKLAFRHKKNDYRIVYQINHSQIKILMIAIGSRENFYQRLKT